MPLAELETIQGHEVTIQVLNNDTDPDGDTLRVAIAVAPPQGSAYVTPDMSAIVYTPNPGFVGTDGMGYFAIDGSGAKDSAIIVIVVAP